MPARRKQAKRYWQPKMRHKQILFTLSLILLSLNTFSQIVLDEKYEGFIKNKAGLNGFVNRSLNISNVDTIVNISFNENELNHLLRIIYFELTIVNLQKDPLTFVNSVDGQLTKEMKEALMKVSPGNKIYIERIKAVSKDNQTYSLFATDYIVD
jgi:hypothetical protein